MFRGSCEQLKTCWFAVHYQHTSLRVYTAIQGQQFPERFILICIFYLMQLHVKRDQIVGDILYTGGVLYPRGSVSSSIPAETEKHLAFGIPIHMSHIPKQWKMSGLDIRGKWRSFSHTMDMILIICEKSWRKLHWWFCCGQSCILETWLLLNVCESILVNVRELQSHVFAFFVVFYVKHTDSKLTCSELFAEQVSQPVKHWASSAHCRTLHYQCRRTPHSRTIHTAARCLVPRSATNLQCRLWCSQERVPNTGRYCTSLILRMFTFL